MVRGFTLSFNPLARKLILRCGPNDSDPLTWDAVVEEDSGAAGAADLQSVLDSTTQQQSDKATRENMSKAVWKAKMDQERDAALKVSQEQEAAVIAAAAAAAVAAAAASKEAAI